MLRIGILGASRIAPEAIIHPARRVPGVEVVAVAAGRPGAAAAYAALHGIPTAYDGYEALLEDPRIDLVYNALAVRDHVALSIAALEAGKDVLCEKPIAMDAAEAERLVTAAGRTGRRAIEAFHYRHHPLFAEVERLLAGRALGRIRTLRSEIVDPREFDPGSVLHDPALGGGALLHAGCYAVDWMRALAGEPVVESASAERNPLGADATVEATLAFPDDVRGALLVSMAPGSTMPAGNRLTIQGDRGSMAIENLIVPQFGHSIRVRIDGEPERVSTVAGGASYDYQLAAVATALERGTRLPSEGTALVRGMAAIDAIRRASGLAVSRA